MKLPGKKWLILIAVVAVLILIGILIGSRQGGKVEMVLETVERGQLIQTVEASGELESIDEVDLSFDTSGTVENVYFEVGDEVEAGDKIARLDADELEADVERAEQAVRIAQASLELQYAGSTTEAIQIAEAGVDIAEAAYDASLVELDNAEDSLYYTTRVYGESVDEAEVTVETAEDTLENTLADNENDIKLARNDLISTMKSNLISIRSALSEADEVIGVDNQLANDDYESILSHANPSYVTYAKNAYGHAKDARDDAETLVFALNASSTDEEIEAAATEVENAFYYTGETLLYTRQALDATTLVYTDFDQTDLSTLKTNIDTVRNDVQTEETAFITDHQGYAATIITADTAEDSARNSLASAEQALVSAQTTRDSKIATAEAAVATAESTVTIKAADLAKAEATLAQTEAGPRSVDIAGLEADVARAGADLAAAEARLARAEITTPIDGIVTEIAVEIGEQVISATPVVTVQTTTEDQFRIVSNIPESDIAKIDIGDTVDITFDAFGDDVHFEGTVGNIDPAEQDIEGVIYYEIEVYLAEDSDEFKPGMSADLTIETEDLSDVLMVPQRAVLERDGVKFVRVPKGSSYEEVTVEVGIRGDGGKLQIISGLTEGQEVITSIRD